MLGVVRGFESHRLHKKVPFFVSVLVLIMQTGKPFRFHTPSSILVVGPSGCGKTVFTEKLLLENPDLFENPRAWCSLGGPGKVFDQDANVG